MIPAPDDPAIGRCRECRHWLKSQAGEFVYHEGQPVPKAMLKGLGIIAQTPTINAAPCTLMPNWCIQPADAWCGQFDGRILVD